MCAVIPSHLPILGQPRPVRWGQSPIKMLFDGAGQPMVHDAIYTAYEYSTSHGKMSRRMSWDGRTRTQVDTEFTYARQRLQSSLVDERTWPEDAQQLPDEWLDRERFLEIYAYNLFGDRIGVLHSSNLTGGDNLYDAGWQSSRFVRTYDYVDGRILVERESDLHGSPPDERFVSVYTWGPMGLISRRGVSVRDGHWDPAGGEDCDPGPGTVMSGAFVYDNRDVMQDYTYMADHMGNIAALVDGESETARRQVFDAFGNNIGGYIQFRCAADHDWTDNPWHNGHPADPPIPPCPNNPAEPTERMQAGSFNWRGSEGSITDRVAEDMPDTEENTVRWSAYTRPSTGLVYMQARYYEPETGRFTQSDPMPYGFETMLSGQNNRWTYCTNDPVNCSDPTGMLIWGLFAGLSFALGFLAGGYFGTTDPTFFDELVATVLGFGVGTVCWLVADKIAKLILIWNATAFGIMFGILAVSFLIGAVLGYVLGRALALNDESLSEEASSLEEGIDDSLQKEYYA